MSNKSLINSLPIVAAAIGKKLGVKVSFMPNLDTACTDGKNIYLPLLPDTDEAVVLARGYIDHECAHVRYTDFSCRMGSGIRKSFINIVEDIRIEQKLGRELPGCKTNLYKLEEMLVGMNVYPDLNDSSHPAEIVGSYIHHGLRVSVLGNDCTQGLADKATAILHKKLPVSMVTKLDAILAQVSTLNNTAEVCKLVDSILALFKQENKDAQDQAQQNQGGDQQQGDSQAGDQESGDGDDSQQGSSQSKGSDSSEKGDDQSGGGDSQSGDGDDSEKGDGDSQSGDGDDSEKGDGDSQSGDGASAGKGDEQSKGDAGAGSGSSNYSQDDADKAESLKQLVEDQNGSHISNSDLGDKIAAVLKEMSKDAKLHGHVTPEFPREASGIKGGHSIDPSVVSSETNALRARLNGLVQASKLTRTPPRRTGSRIDTRSLHKLRMLDTRIFRGSEHKQGVNTAIVVLLDQSSSMRHEAVEATKAAMALAMALDTIPGVKLSVAGFYTDTRSAVVSPMKEFNQRVKKETFVPFANGSTPHAEALHWAASELLSLRQVDRRIVISITDGQPNDWNDYHEITAKMKHASIESHGIGLGMNVDSHGYNSSCMISNVSELPASVFGMIQSMLIKK